MWPRHSGCNSTPPQTECVGVGTRRPGLERFLGLRCQGQTQSLGMPTVTSVDLLDHPKFVAWGPDMARSKVPPDRSCWVVTNDRWTLRKRGRPVIHAPVDVRAGGGFGGGKGGGAGQGSPARSNSGPPRTSSPLPFHGVHAQGTPHVPSAHLSAVLVAAQTRRGVVVQVGAMSLTRSAV